MKKYISKLILTLVVFLLLNSNTYAQTVTPGTAVLSINPTTFTLAGTGSKTTLSVIYTGTPTGVAEIHLTLGSGIKINSFTPGPDISFLYTSTTTNEVHLGNLQGNFTSGQSLFTFEVEATSASQTGQVGFNSSSTFVSNVTPTYAGSTYTIGSSNVTPTPTISGSPVPVTTSYTPTTLPITAISNEYTYVFLSSVSLFGLGFIVWFMLAKARISKREEDVKIITIE